MLFRSRNAINAAFPIITCDSISLLELNDGDNLKINLLTGELQNLNNYKSAKAEPFSSVQYEVYQKGGLLGSD